jgi:hypothetical protein
MAVKINLDNVEKLLKPLSSNRIMVDAVKMFLPKWKSKKMYLMSFVFGGIPSYLMATSEKTVSIFKDGVQLINNITLALFGIVFTGYALFQALIGEEMLVRMINSTAIVDKEEKSKLQESNELFAKIMMMEFICVVICVLLLLILPCIPEDYIAFDNMVLNEVVAGAGICVFFYLSFVTLFEVKSFIFNIFELFNFHAATRVMEILKEDK